MQRHVALAFVVVASVTLRSTPLAAAEQPSLLATISEWQYPGSSLSSSQASDGATVDAAGNRTLLSVVSTTHMTTTAPVQKVLDFYKAKLSRSPENEGGKPKLANPAGRSVIFGDDSGGRPLALHTVIVNTGDTSTTLIISRTTGETKTHIVWKQYRRFGR